MTFTETFYGYIETTTDTLLVFEACRRGILPKISRRLQEKERNCIRSGTVFVFDERESGIKRWTDGLIWSPSRILGNFLIYRELDGRDNSLSAKRVDQADRGFYDLPYSEQQDAYYSSSSYSQQQQQQQQQQQSFEQVNRYRERALVGSLTTSYRFKSSGLIKKTMSIVVNGSHLHLISYYNKNDVLNNTLPTPSTTSQLAHLHISSDMIQRQSFRVSPLIESPLSQHYAGNNFAVALSSRDAQHVKSLPSPSCSPCSSSPNSVILNNNYQHQQAKQQQLHHSPSLTKATDCSVMVSHVQRKRRSSSPNTVNQARKFSRIHTDELSLRSSSSSLSSPREPTMYSSTPVTNSSISHQEYLLYDATTASASTSYHVSPPQQDLKLKTSFLPMIDTTSTDHSTTPSPHHNMRINVAPLDYSEAPPSPTSHSDNGRRHPCYTHHQQQQQQQRQQQTVVESVLNNSLDYFTPSPPIHRTHQSYAQEEPSYHQRHGQHHYQQQQQPQHHQGSLQQQQHHHILQEQPKDSVPHSPLLPPAPSTPMTTSSTYMTCSPTSSPPALDRHVYHPSVRHASMIHPSTAMYSSTFSTPF